MVIVVVVVVVVVEEDDPALVDVVSNPSEAFAITLSLQHRTHEQLQRAARQLIPRYFVLQGEDEKVRTEGREGRKEGRKVRRRKKGKEGEERKEVKRIKNTNIHTHTHIHTL